MATIDMAQEDKEDKATRILGNPHNFLRLATHMKKKTFFTVTKANSLA